MSKRGRGRAKTRLQRHPENIVFPEVGSTTEQVPFVLTRPQEDSDDFFEIRDTENFKLCGRAIAGHTLVRCPSCKHEYVFTWDKYLDVSLRVLKTGECWRRKCAHCTRADPILSIEPGPPPMIYFWLK